jgi:hypothetical protein
MDFRQLRYFVAIVDAGSLMKGSERLHIAQPALSVQMRKLEAELGVPLLSRSSRGVNIAGSTGRASGSDMFSPSIHQSARGLACKSGEASDHGAS